MWEQVQQRLSEKSNFVMEKPLSTRSYFNLIRQSHLIGLNIVLNSFYLLSPAIVVERVKLWLNKSGHKIAGELTARRYHLSIQLFS